MPKTRITKTDVKFLEFYLLVLKYEHVYPTQKLAFLEAEKEMLESKRSKAYPSWNAFRCNVHQRIGEYSFYISRLRHFEYGLDFVIGVYTRKDECDIFSTGVGAKIPGCTVTIYTSATGRLDATAQEIVNHNFNKA